MVVLPHCMRKQPVRHEAAGSFKRLMYVSPTHVRVIRCWVRLWCIRRVEKNQLNCLDMIDPNKPASPHRGLSSNPVPPRTPTKHAIRDNSSSFENRFRLWSTHSGHANPHPRRAHAKTTTVLPSPLPPPLLVHHLGTPCSIVQPLLVPMRLGYSCSQPVPLKNPMHRWNKPSGHECT